MQRFFSVLFYTITLAATAQVHPSPTAAVAALASRFLTQSLQYDTTQADLNGISFPDHSRFADISPAGIAAFAQAEQVDLRDLHAISPNTLPDASRATYAILEEQLEADLGMRVCKPELWDVNHFSGWQSTFAEVASQQPVATAEDRAAALHRWGSFPQYLDTDIRNLRQGLDAGYSAPQSVVRRVIAQMDAFLAAPPEKLPFDSPAQRSGDPAFQAQFRHLLATDIHAVLGRYRDFLVNDYLPRARTGIAIADLPDGPACYAAFLRSNTTLTRTPQQVFDLGSQTVAANQADVRRLGQQTFGSSDIPTILARAKSRPEDHFHSKEELLAFSRSFLARARTLTARKLIARMPAQDAVIEPERPFEEQAGVSSHYIPEPDPGKPSIFRIELGNWVTETRGEAEITTCHETWPGHHLQIATARDLLPNEPLSRLISNSAYAEGWARYAEAMSEEAGIYETPGALIFRRLWPARGMVVDPGLHAMHWTRQQAVDYILAAGRDTPKSADDLVDRIAVMPGQLTSYDSGGLEIKALRREAEDRLGPRFQLQAFNLAVLSEGIVPLRELRRHIMQWITTQLPPSTP